jgi:putative ABC transport system permease protein
MGLKQLVRFAGGAVLAHRLRSALTMLGILIGVASVILLTSIGEGTRAYIMDEFTQFGTNIMAINPGRVATTGLPGALGGTLHKLTLDDADALARIPGVERFVPVAFGMAKVEAGKRGRSVVIYGVNDQVPEVWTFRVRQGRFLPPGDPRRGAPVTVLGPKLKREIFGERSALGEYVRIGGQRLQVIGVMEPKGLLLGFDIDDSAYIPVSVAQRLFNRDDLLEIDLLFSNTASTDAVAEAVRSVLIERHDGEEDFTVTTQTGMLDVMGRVMDIIGLAVGGIAAISLLVGAIGILTMMWIAVGERTAEIGLARAVGARPGQILLLFLGEATLLSLLGGALGVATGMGIARLLQLVVPGLPVETPLRFVVAALGVSLVAGLLSGVLPARRAAALDPVEALRAE